LESGREPTTIHAVMPHSRDELAAILEGIDTAVVVVDRDWRVTY